ncbi:MAG TPA: acetyltransferase [Kamptonema sp.]|nr:acetyltransferase [Kamptonema sp.]
MFLKEKESGTLIEILDVDALLSPTKNQVPGRIQAGQEEQDRENFDKTELIFPSGEILPRCWMDENYTTN